MLHVEVAQYDVAREFPVGCEDKRHEAMALPLLELAEGFAGST
jgi:hypothetical protein